jgi:hypothetical protein
MGGDDPDEVAGDLSRQQAIETALQAVKPWNDDTGVSQKVAADIVGYSAGWINDRVREWRNGQYRELVNDPLDASNGAGVRSRSRSPREHI